MKTCPLHSHVTLQMPSLTPLFLPFPSTSTGGFLFLRLSLYDLYFFLQSAVLGPNFL
ncbi:unnamed protein product [Meloidogyne enterolobii]|uniref:Uncharacterized protein n=1 Tax=Meloidogyne enterolobii TaxID=390850 RepID=A0ACB0Z8M1_MELEN